MRRIIAVFTVLLLLCSCNHKTQQEKAIKKEKPFYGIWVTYSELESAAKGDFKSGFKEIVKNAKELNATALFIHVRAMSDSVYPSLYYPTVSWAKELNYDPLLFMTELCNQEDIEFHAWINPYRISSSKSNLSQISENSPAQLLSSEIGNTEKGLYFNPASAPARKLVIDGIKEILNNYDIDGIHFDDYFYPTDNKEFDQQSYDAYCAQNQNPLPLEKWRQINVNLLIAGVKSAINSSGKSVIFSVSPAADIENNENVLFADVDYWCDSGYIDAVIPQLYFGFDYPDSRFCFEQLLSEWISYIKSSQVKLYIGLAPYKLNTESKADKAEWQNGTEIVAKQIELIKNNQRLSGAVLFSYSYLFSQSQDNTEQRQNIKNSINK